MEKKIKIGIVGLNTTQLFHFQSILPFGGSEVQLFQLAKILSKEKDFQIDFLLKSDTDIPPKENYSKNIRIISVKNYTL